VKLNEWLMLLALSVLWGGSFFFVGVAVRELPVFTIVVARVSIGAIALWLFLRLMGERIPRQWPAFFGMGLLNNAIPFVLFVSGQQHIASGLAAILNATTPLFTVIAAHVLTRDERLTGAKLAGMGLGLMGVAVMLGPDLLRGLGANLLAQLACLAAAFSYGLAGIFGRRFRRLGVPPVATAAGQLIASSAILSPLMLLWDRPWGLPMPGVETWAALIGIGLLSTALAYVLYFRILATAGATNLLLVTFLIPVTAILLGVLVLGERLAGVQILGMLFIGAGLACMDGRLAYRTK
jgi:drug/metabolite transporter (DMT)-like permease